MKKLDVVFRGWGQAWVLGTLADADGTVHFAYSSEALRRRVEHSPLHLPLEPLGARLRSGFPPHFNALPGFINDALPDGWGMLLMDRVFRQAGRDPATLSPLDRLSFIGERAMGALAFVPSADAELGEQDLSLLALARAAQQVIQSNDVAMLKTLARLGGSPHGARPKALVHFDPRSGVINTRSTPTTPTTPTTNEGAAGQPWIVKFPAGGEHKEVCAIEATYAELARACGVDVPPTQHFDLGRGLAAFGAQRFDRVHGMRVPVQSFAAALHADFRLPSIDYEQVLRVTRFFTRDERDVARAYRRCVFNVVFNNRDDHAKNFAFLMDDTMRWRLAPAYDLTFSMGPAGQHQTSVLGVGMPGRAELLRLADLGGVDVGLAEEIIKAVCAQVPSLQRRLSNAGVRAATVRHMAGAVAANAARCKAPRGRG